MPCESGSTTTTTSMIKVVGRRYPALYHYVRYADFVVASEGLSEGSECGTGEGGGMEIVILA
jgi:hypothetical protein